MFRQLLFKQAQVFAYNRSFKKLLSAKEVYAFGSSAAYSNDNRLKLKQDNVIGSPFPSVSGYDNILLHELIWMNVHKWSNKTALECSSTGRSYTYHQLKKLTGRLATSLRKAKILPRDTVAVVLPNIPEYATVVLATSEAGLRVRIWCTRALHFYFHVRPCVLFSLFIRSVEDLSLNKEEPEEMK